MTGDGTYGRVTSRPTEPARTVGWPLQRRLAEHTCHPGGLRRLQRNGRRHPETAGDHDQCDWGGGASAGFGDQRLATLTGPRATGAGGCDHVQPLRTERRDGCTGASTCLRERSRCLSRPSYGNAVYTSVPYADTARHLPLDRVLLRAICRTHSPSALATTRTRQVIVQQLQPTISTAQTFTVRDTATITVATARGQATSPAVSGSGSSTTPVVWQARLRTFLSTTQTPPSPNGVPVTGSGDFAPVSDGKSETSRYNVEPGALVAGRYTEHERGSQERDQYVQHRERQPQPSTTSTVVMVLKRTARRDPGAIRGLSFFT